ncbi:MAG TPA: hypothetical protein GX404_06500 [Syntrophomonadaceae bacterium]|nr:hypothetical protein [Syntrophomonadaceae bacterium]
MGEYLKYSLLIFIPVGCFLFWYLVRQGIEKKTTVGILVLSLVFIITFPLSMAYMGFVLACVVYLFILGCMVVILNRTIEKSYSSDEQVLSDAGEVSSSYSTTPFDSDGSESAPSSYYEGMAAATETESMVLESQASGKTIEELQEEPQEELQEVLQEEQQEGLQEEPQEAMLSEEENFLPDAEADQLDLKAESAPWQATIEDSSEEMSEHLLEFSVAAVYEPENMVMKNEDGGTDVDLRQDIPIDVDLLHNEEGAETRAREKDEQIKENTFMVNELLEEGFRHKFNEDEAAAVHSFMQAYELSGEEELRGMLALEIANLHKNAGHYDAAQEILAITIGNAKNQTAIIKDIKLQLSFLQVLITELDRLGLHAIPFSQVPRWVRLKVADRLQSDQSK